MSVARLPHVILALVCLAPILRAHEGPPFPVVVDEVHGPWTVEIWADPDVGLGTFWVQLRAAEGRTLPDDTKVWVFAAPADGRQEPLRWPSEREPFRAGQQHVAEVELPTREFWTIRALIESASAGAHEDVSFNVEVTPPGYGPIDLLLYTWPFLAVAFLWWKGLRRHHAHEADRRPAAKPPSLEPPAP
jgi:hypothetical protein